MELRIDLNENDPAEALLLSVLRGLKRGTRPYILSRILLRYLDDYAIPLGDVDKIVRCVQFYCNEELPPKSGAGLSVVAAENRTALFASKTKPAEKKNKPAPKKTTARAKKQIEDIGSKESTAAQNTETRVTTASSVPKQPTAVEQEPARMQELAVAPEGGAVQAETSGIPKWKDENGRPLPMDKETAQRFKALAPKEYKEYLLLLMNTRATL